MPASGVFPITKDLPDRIAQWYDMAEEGDIALIEQTGVVITRKDGYVLWDDGDKPGPYPLSVALAFLQFFARIATL